MTENSSLLAVLNSCGNKYRKTHRGQIPGNMKNYVMPIRGRGLRYGSKVRLAAGPGVGRGMATLRPAPPPDLLSR
ncbi:hypothetical protein NHX12_021171 [Muraenolepis orangiensis]|uniref:Uncharacterized protein n=1 Tax=Muraenolepis orangiensis TaxID=630683 RepID=A0A9Q0IUS3_9TELE|nr:hypothetical protein NHX12_021171 [Muraenolepis orangiensis]